MNTEQPARKRIADIIRDSGKMGSDSSASSADLTAALSAISGAPPGVMAISEALSDELSKRFTRLSAKDTVDFDFDAPYETTGRALILALQDCNQIVSAAFDTASGAILETKKAVSLLAPPFTVAIAISDRGTTTHVSGQAQHVGVDWGQNKKLLNELYAKVGDYIKLFSA